MLVIFYLQSLKNERIHFAGLFGFPFTLPIDAPP